LNKVIESQRNANNIEEKVFSPDEVRKILGMDKEEIKRFCKQNNVIPKKSVNTGNTFFLGKDVEVLKRVKDMLDKGQRIAGRKQPDITEAVAENAKSPETQAVKPLQKHFPENDIRLIANSIIEAQSNIVEKLSAVLDEKLDGMDEIVVELIRCKTDNESLKNKINELTRENHRMQEQLNSFNSIGFGLYLKKDGNILR
jgi:DNA-binding transcriptional MerR regulator